MFEARQGDVYLVRIDEPLPDCEKAAPVGVNHILAYGESTGHAHAIRADRCDLLHANDNLREVAARHGVTDGRAVAFGLRVIEGGATLYHGTPTQDYSEPRDPDHTPIDLPAGDYIVLVPREYDDSEEFRRIAD